MGMVPGLEPNYSFSGDVISSGVLDFFLSKIATNWRGRGFNLDQDQGLQPLPHYSPNLNCSPISHNAGICPRKKAPVLGSD